MPHPLYVAFIWHQHQPLYKSHQDVAQPAFRHYHLPWVRLHGAKDYLDLVLLLERYPKLHQTVNLVPSLILQLEDYIAGTALDPYLAVSLTSTEQLDGEQRQYIIEHFFDANYSTLIAPHPRYAQLYQQRQEKGQAWCLENWQLQDYSDLLAWHNLAWIDPLFWDDPEIAAWLQQGRDFTLSDRQRIYSKQRQILSRIIPQHRQMQEAGQLEVTTTPYTHPILPLLADTNASQVAVPNMTLPMRRFQWAEDIPRHLRLSWDLYRDRFGREPLGLWPSEQSVSPQILPDIVKQGFQWICSDEAVLGWTLKHFFHRGGNGNVLEPELLYQPYRLTTTAGDLAIVFRDHRLSDLIGFTYASMEPKHAAEDLVRNLEAIAYQLKQRQTSGSTALEQPWLVNIALDGENCWEFYQQDGKPFLENLYQMFSDHTELQLVTVSEYLAKFPATTTIPANELHSGSWVDGSFTTWIGDPVKNRAWDLLAEARAVLAKHPEATEENNPAAWEALYAAEGSDWFWWFGEGHSSNQDDVFDLLFREHLCELYQALNEPVPPYLRQPVETNTTRTDYRIRAFIHPVINGQGNEQEWEQAGRLEVGGARGTMHQSSAIQRLWYGMNRQNFYLRLDFKVGVQPGRDYPGQLHLLWFYPDQSRYNSPVPLENVPNAPPVNYLFHHHLALNLLARSVLFQEANENFQWCPRVSHALVAFDRCLEIAVPWADLQISFDSPLRLILVMADSGRFSSYLPENALISIEMPYSASFDK
ncbi:MAG: glycoside hydrolase [Chroococcidiopsidaceae cyanobacterium CP_BM_ER_R8_30]|nr:glycoside hydrolase [Chroococcidiopsidaceae cyanobacterium CP_BM_ER_R8_30]